MDPESINTALLKAELRSRLLAARTARPAAEIETARSAITAHLLARRPELTRPWPCVAAYQPLRTEPGSIDLLASLAASGVRVLVPIVLDDRDLSWAQWTESGLGSPLGRSAVGDAALVLVPALAVDARGQRLGRGGGSYDRALARVAAGTPIVALLYDDELLDTVPVAPWDRPVTAALTPAGWHQLG